MTQHNPENKECPKNFVYKKQTSGELFQLASSSPCTCPPSQGEEKPFYDFGMKRLADSISMSISADDVTLTPSPKVVEVNDWGTREESPAPTGWEKVAAEVALQAWKREGGYAEHSQRIYVAFAEALATERERTLTVLDEMRSDEYMQTKEGRIGFLAALEAVKEIIHQKQ